MTACLLAPAAAPLGAQERVPPVQAEPLRSLSRHVGWGMAIGAAGGLLYAVATAEKDRTFGVVAIGYVAAGGLVGMAGGAITWAIRSMRR